MNAISKRLLSWLCVIAMVLSFVPAMNLSASAAETEAAEEIVYGSANFDGVDAAIIEQMNKGNAIDNSDAAIDAAIAAGTCPMCGATGITWEKKTNGFNTNDKQDQVIHAYFDTEFATASNLIQSVNWPAGDPDSVNNKICVALKSTANITCNKYRIQINGTDNVVNIMGTGKIHADNSASDQKDLGLFQIEGKNPVVNLYGGQFTHAHRGDDFQKAVIRVGTATAKVNIFAGVKIGPETLDTTKVAMNIQFTQGGTVNMFGGEIRNGVSPAWGYSGNVTVSSKGVFNMYGGTISGGAFLNKENLTAGVTMDATIGGNVMVGGKNTAAYYKDGKDNYEVTDGTFNMYGGTITGGKANNGGNGGGNVYSCRVLNIVGGTIEGGYAKVGGNVQVNGGTAMIGGTALITGGEAANNGGNLLVKAGATTVNGGKIAGGKATNGGNINIAGTATISGGIIENGTATANGGNINVEAAAEGKVTISGGTIRGGIAEKQGGNISTSADLTLAGADILDGIGRAGGGNVNVAANGKTLVVESGTIAGGWVTGPWDKATETYKPTGANWGGNIRAWCANVEIKGGLIYGGMRGMDKHNHAGNNVSSLATIEKSGTKPVEGGSLTISGGVIVGDVNVSAPSANATGELTCPGTTVVLKGAPVITNKYTMEDGSVLKATAGGLNLTSTAVVNIDELSADAKVVVTAAMDKVLTVPSENAANVVKCFSTSNSATAVALNEKNELYVIEKPVVIEPVVRPEPTLGGDIWTDEAWAKVEAANKIQGAALNLDPKTATTCPACGATGITWTEVNSKPGEMKTADTSYHYYIGADSKVDKQYNWYTSNVANVTMCLLLKNGNTAKEIGGLIGMRNSATGCTLNIMGNGIITSNGAATSDAQFGVISVQGSENTVNLYGGTFIYTGDGEGRKHVDANGNGQYDKGEVYEPTGAAYAAAINLKGHTNTVNMFNDVVVGPETQDLTKPCYNVRIEVSAASKSATFNMYGGTIRNGVTKYANTSGNVHIHYQDKFKTTTPEFNMFGGSIVNGNHMEGTGNFQGGNIYARAGAQMNISGGIISGGVAKNGGNVYIDTSSLTKVNIAGGTITGGKANYGGNLYVKATTEIGGYALIENGYAESNGGNIYLTEKKTVTQKSGSEVRNGTCNGTGGGNLIVNAGCTYNMEGGKLYDGKNLATGSNANAGNILVQGTAKVDKEAQTTTFTDAIFNMSGDAEVYGGKTYNQGGNIRAYIGTVTMTDNAKVYGGAAENNSTDNIWLVDGKLIMDGKATVYGNEEGNGSAIQGAVYRRGSEVVLRGEATAITEEGAASSLLSLSEGSHAEFKTPLQSRLVIDNNWTGTAYIRLPGNTQLGGAIDEKYAICGTEADGVITKGGTFAGKLYYGNFANSPVVGADGILTLSGKNAVAKADGSSAWFETAAEALANYKFGEDQYVILSEDATISSDVVIELAGQNITLSGNGKVYGLDSTNDTFKTFGTITVAEGAEIEYAPVTYHPASTHRYVAVMNENVLSFHYLTMVINEVTLRTEGAGVYYKSKFKCDDTLAAAINGYGMILSLNDTPGADFMTAEDINLATLVEGPLTLDANGECIATSGAVTGILKAERTAAENQQIAEMKIYANTYVKVGENVIVYKGENPYTEIDPEKDAYSLKDVLVAIDDGFSKYSVKEQNIIKKFYNTWKDQGISAWDAELENIIAYEIVPENVTIAEAITIGKAQAHNTYTEDKYIVKGMITEVYNANYGNMYITDGEGNTFTIYGTYDATGEVSYKDMESKPDAGDMVTILGTIGQYNKDPQIKNGWILEFVPGELPEVEEPEGEKISISFDDRAQRTVFTAEQQVWVQNGITVTNDKAGSSNDVADYAAPARFYKSSKVTVECAGMKTIVVNCNTPTYADALKNSIVAAEGVTVTVNGTAVTVEFAAAVDAVVIEALTAQVRVNSIDIYK